MDKNFEYYIEILKSHGSRSYADDYASQISQILNKAEKDKNNNLAISWLASGMKDSFLLDINLHEKKESLSEEEFMKRTDIILNRLRNQIIEDFRQTAITGMFD